ncbi:MAG: ABC transporter substrate-binding protein [Planctomycetota bacterium]|nr:ABC transporter substrate-binding protein [Planctomycetota bacterium]MDP7248173.1 ABC transporter substrate-binding protein [Planctomycetota bacterium]
MKIKSGIIIAISVVVLGAGTGYLGVREKEKLGDAQFKRHAFAEAQAAYKEALSLAFQLSDEQKRKYSRELREVRYKEAASIARQQTLRIGEITYPETFEAITAKKPVEQRLGQLMYHPLVSLDERGQKWIGILAKKWSASIDRLSYTFELKKEYRWPNGRAITAYDVDFTIDAIRNPETENFDPFLASFFRKTTIHDPFKISIHLTRQFFEPLSLLSFKILPRYPFHIPMQLRDMTASWRTIKRNRSYRFTLRKSIHWPNGDTVSPKDLVYTAKRRRVLAERGTPERDGVEIEEILPDAENGVRIMLRAPPRNLGALFSINIFPEYAVGAPLTVRDLVKKTRREEANDYVLELRDDVSWPAGKSVTPEDLKRVIDQAAAGSSKSALSLKWIRSSEVLDGNSLRLRTTDSLQNQPRFWELQILPPGNLATVALTAKHWFRRTPIGSGPFLRDPSGDKGQSELFFKRNPGYFLAARPPAPIHRTYRPFLSGIGLKIYHDRSAARQALEIDRAKETSIDVSVELRPLDIEFFANLPENYYLRRFKTWKVHFLAFNFRRRLFQKKEIRQAINMGLERRAVLEKIFRGGRGGQPHVLLSGPYPKGSWAYSPLVDVYQFDAKGAREMLAQAGIPNPSFSLKFPSYDRNIERACTNFQETLEELGFEVRLERKLERDLHDEVINEQDFDVAYMTHTFDETLNLAPLLDSSRTKKGASNYMGYESDLLMERFREMNARPNAERIQAIAQDIHKHCHEEAVLCMLWQLDIWSAFRNEVKQEQVSIHPFLFYNRPQDWTVR